MNSTLITIITVYLFILPVLGILGHRMARERTLKDYYLAGGTLGTIPLFFTFYATQYSGNTLLGFAGNAYRNGPVMLFSALGMMSVVIVFSLIGPRLHHWAKQLNFVTPGDFILHRFNSRLLLTLVNLVLIATLASYILTNFKAVGLLVERITDGQLPIAYGIMGLAVIMAFYESLGGLRSVVWTDMLQGSLLLVGCIGVAAAVIYVFGGPANLLNEVAVNQPQHWQPMDSRQWIRGISIVVLFASAISLYPHAIQRIYAAQNWPTLKRSFWMMAGMPFVTTLPVILTAMAATLLLPGLQGSEADQVIPRLLTYLMNELPALNLLLALFMAAAIAAIMSTIDSTLLSLGSIFTHDIIRPVFPAISQARLTRMGKLMSWALMLSMAALALILPQTIWSLMVIKLEMLGQILPVMLLGTRWKAVRAMPLICGLIVGCGLSLILRFGFPEVDLMGLHAGVVGLAANFATVGIVHFLRREKPVIVTQAAK